LSKDNNIINKMNNRILIFYMISLLFNIFRIYNMAMTNSAINSAINNNTYYELYEPYELYDNIYHTKYTLNTNTLKLVYLIN
jgi:hypothetical protein